MKVVILAGGFGTRISEESHLVPKPMIQIGNMPIIWHIMKYYMHFGHNEFIICAGYKQYVIKEFFNNYYLHTSDVTFDFRKSIELKFHESKSEKWKVTVVDTGLNTMTGGRIKKIKEHLNGEDFLLTYGDGLSDVNINDLINFHYENKSMLTLTAIQPGGRFGSIEIDDSQSVNSFVEKSINAGGWINGGFMIVSNGIFDLEMVDETVFEKDILPSLAEKKQLSAYKHHGFWQSMDTLRDKNILESYVKKDAPWIKW